MLSPEEISLAEKVVGAVMAYFTWRTRKELNIAYGKIRELQGLGPNQTRKGWRFRKPRKGKDRATASVQAPDQAHDREVPL